MIFVTFNTDTDTDSATVAVAVTVVDADSVTIVPCKHTLGKAKVNRRLRPD
jgi:hypothetical protein